MTVIKASFLGSARFGSGVVVARLADGTWSAPSAVTSGGAGFGAQVGLELTDFVFILNDYAAVRTFAQAGSLQFGGNVSVAAGPVGRNAEMAGAASLKSVAPVFAYSKTKGLFAGVSVEGSALFERKEANAKLYHGPVTAIQLLQGNVKPPPEAENLYRVLNSRVFSGAVGGNTTSDAMYNDIPVYDDSHEDVVWQGQRGSAYGEGVRSGRTPTHGDNYEYRDRPSRANTWTDNVYDREPSSAGAPPSRSFTTRANPSETFEKMDDRTRSGSNAHESYNYSDNSKPSRPTAPKPKFGAQKTGSLGSNQALAKFTFEAEQKDDLGFKKGDVITIVKRTDNPSDWWTGRIGDREGVFPRHVPFRVLCRSYLNE